MSYRVKLNVFEGPFDLLVYLIEHAEMSIYDIRVSEITAQYMEYIAAMEKEDINVSSEFMVLAAELLEIKSKMLLPRSAEAGSEASGYEDPRTELVAKLEEYKKYKAISEMLQRQYEETSNILEKPQEDLAEYTGQPDELLMLDPDKFVLAFEDFLQRKKRLEEIREHHIRTRKQRVTTELRMAGIKDFFRERPVGTAVDFRELVPVENDRYETAVTFSSVLELMKEKRLLAEQKYLFGDISVKATEHIFEEGEA